jgi:hypothetical protein
LLRLLKLRCVGVILQYTYVPKSKPTKADGKKKSKKGKKGKQQSGEEQEEQHQPQLSEKDDTEEVRRALWC